jgi:hypothetical protein
MERLRNTRHPRLRMDLFAWKVFMARMVSRAIWQMCAWMEVPSPSFALLADIRGRGRKEGRKEGRRVRGEIQDDRQVREVSKDIYGKRRSGDGNHIPGDPPPVGTMVSRPPRLET